MKETEGRGWYDTDDHYNLINCGWWYKTGSLTKIVA